MLCSRCKKRLAVVFVAIGNDPKPQGLCTVCAKELGLTQVTDLMDKMGITDDMVEEANEQLSEMMKGDDPTGLFAFLKNDADGDGDSDGTDAPDSDGEGFEMGGTPTFPEHLRKFIDAMRRDDAADAQRAAQSAEPPRTAKREAPPKRKYIRAYCENLTEKARSGKLDAVIGRDKEIARVIQILSRRHEKQPLPDRRAGRRQNRHRGRASRSGLQRATCRSSCGTRKCTCST